jgi:hypothetical protein
VNETLAQLAEMGIVIKLGRGRYRINPVFSYRGAGYQQAKDGSREFVQIDQSDVLEELRNSPLPEQVRYPNLDALKREIDRERNLRAARRAERTAQRRPQRKNPDQTEITLDDIETD